MNPALPALALLLGQAVPSTDGPLAPARAGLVQCNGADPVARTCRSMVRYTPQADGSWRTTTTLPVPSDSSHAATIEMHAIVEVRDGAVCDRYRPADIDAASVRVDGKAAPPELANGVKARLKRALAAFAGKEFCTGYERLDADSMVSRVALDGVPQPDMGSDFRWVRPDDQYRTQPIGGR